MINTNSYLTCNQTNKLCVRSPFVTQKNSSRCAVRQCVSFFMGKICVTWVPSLSRELRWNLRLSHFIKQVRPVSQTLSFYWSCGQTLNWATPFKPENHSMKWKVTPDTGDGIPTLFSVSETCVTKSDSSRYLAGWNSWHAETQSYFFQSAFFFSAYPHLFPKNCSMVVREGVMCVHIVWLLTH